MKIFTTILKILAALAAVVGVIYVVVTYGESIVAWIKTQLAKYGLYTFPEEEADSVDSLYETDEAPEAEGAEDEVIAENTVQAEDGDFQNE